MAVYAGNFAYIAGGRDYVTNTPLSEVHVFEMVQSSSASTAAATSTTATTNTLSTTTSKTTEPRSERAASDGAFIRSISMYAMAMIVWMLW